MSETKKALVVGAGEMCKQIMPAINRDKLKIIAVIDDTLPVGENRLTFGVPLINGIEAQDVACDYILVARRTNDFKNYARELKARFPGGGAIISLDFEERLAKPPAGVTKIRAYFLDAISEYLRSADILEFINPELIIYGAWFREIIYAPRHYTDPVRRMTADLLAREIKNRRLPGNIAELGVFRADFAVFLQEIFPEKTFYLFDTFSGFNREQHSRDINAFGVGFEDFGDTSVEYVKKRLDSSLCVIKPGFFPESAVGVNDPFCFVSIDVDLYEPTLAGLEFFWPRLVSGGYIMVHDYGYLPYEGCGKAIREFCQKYGLSFTPVSDRAVSAILAKP